LQPLLVLRCMSAGLVAAWEVLHRLGCLQEVWHASPGCLYAVTAAGLLTCAAVRFATNWHFTYRDDLLLLRRLVR
jgi:hypothetical protein